MNVIRVDAVAQAHRMLQRLEDLRPGAADRLHVDALAELLSWSEVQVRRVPDSLEQTRCSVAGGYVHSTVPPTLAVTESLSHRRRQFTVLHELGHHLQKNDSQLAVAVRRQPADNESFEDAACDLFASRVLLPEEVLGTQPAGRSPTAADIVALFERTQASRAACCVRMAERLGTHGVVAVLDATGTVSFAAGRGEVYPPARGSSQAGTPLVAAALRGGGDVRVDDTYVEYSTGTKSELLYGDAAWSGEYLITVAVLDRPGWRAFAPPRTGTRQFLPSTATCEVCDEEFTPSETCPKCGTARCPSGHCTCTLTAERLCQEGCFQLLHPGRFPSRTATVCRDCAG